MLGVLCQDGIMRFINIITFSQLFDVGRLDDRVNSVSVSPTGRHIVAVMDSGHVNVYSVQALTQECNKVHWSQLETLTSVASIELLLGGHS